MNRNLPKYSAQAGFTLIEVLVTMALFIIVLVIASDAFNRIVSQASKYSKMEESNIEGVIGLEILRHDLGQMGFGLPWGWAKVDNAISPTRLIVDSTATISYLEAANSPASTFNDSPSKVPRGLAGSSVLGQFTSAYIAIKGTTVGRNKTSQHWTHIPFRNLSSRPAIFSANSPVSGDKVTMVTSHYNDAALDHRLIVDPDTITEFYQSFTPSGMLNKYLPTDDQQTYMVYGIDTDSPRMPFNRSDYFIKIPSGVSTTGDGDLPPFCAPRTGVLYKATVNHADGEYNYIPLLDCVASMQVVLGWTPPAGCQLAAGKDLIYTTLPKADNTIAASQTTDTANCVVPIQKYLTDTDTTDYSKAQALRENLKVVKVYILAQEGKLDRNYTSPTTSIDVGDRITNGYDTTKVYTLSGAQQKYRWKLYRIVVRPKNLSSNQL